MMYRCARCGQGVMYINPPLSFWEFLKEIMMGETRYNALYDSFDPKKSRCAKCGGEFEETQTQRNAVLSR